MTRLPPDGDAAIRPVDLPDVGSDTLTDWLAMMLLIREFEAVCGPLALSARMVTAIHSSAGQEAVAVGSIAALDAKDLVVGPHRTHHHAMAKGMEPRALMAELFGRVTGCSRGRGGTMHLRDVAHGYLGGNGIVGAGIGIAVGTALAAKLRTSGQVTVTYVGDGGVNTGRTWEAINLAVVWELPVIVICENNLYAVETDSAQMTGGHSVMRRAEGFGVPAVSVDGQDIGSVYRAVREGRERATKGDGPTFIEALTYRYEGHQTGQKITYRTQAEVEAWRASMDPIERMRLAMMSAGVLTAEEFSQLADKAVKRVEDAVEYAESSAWPEPDTVLEDVTGMDLGMRGNP